MKKWISRTIDWILGILIVGLVSVDVSMLLSEKDHYGVPFLGNYGYLRVLTDSMVGKNSDSLNVGTGIVIEKKATSTVKVNDVITFFDAEDQGATPLQSYVTHRVMEITTDANGLVFYCFGDNPNATSWGSSTTVTYPEVRNVVREKYYIGTVVSHSDSFGAFLGVVQSAWFVPVAVLAPLTVIAAISSVDLFKQAKKEEADEKAAVAAELAAAGVDPKDERAVLLYEEKARYKYELAKEMEKEKQKEKEKIKRELEKEAKTKGKKEEQA